jgi:hypothetical protein
MSSLILKETASRSAEGLSERIDHVKETLADLIISAREQAYEVEKLHEKQPDPYEAMKVVTPTQREFNMLKGEVAESPEQVRAWALSTAEKMIYSFE